MFEYIEVQKPYVGARFTFGGPFDEYAQHKGKRGVILEIVTNTDLEVPEDEYRVLLDDGTALTALAPELEEFYRCEGGPPTDEAKHAVLADL